MSESKANDEYVRLLKYLEYTLHELPAGVLYAANGADGGKRVRSAEALRSNSPNSCFYEKIVVALGSSPSRISVCLNWFRILAALSPPSRRVGRISTFRLRQSVHPVQTRTFQYRARTPISRFSSACPWTLKSRASFGAKLRP